MSVTLSLNSKATPLTRLTRHKKDFQERALAHSLKLAQSGGNEEAGEKRSALSSIERSSTGERRRNGLADTRGGLTLAGKRPIGNDRRLCNQSSLLLLLSLFLMRDY
tara:strand:- start:841 stop:1161 length:321 start_codon:yes stop_codon:yes gene_type:complete